MHIIGLHTYFPLYSFLSSYLTFTYRNDSYDTYFGYVHFEFARKMASYCNRVL